jgi:nucleoside-diphosphate-sugar epimerase
MRVLVIGGTRFIGPHVVRQLHRMGHDVALLHRGQTEAELPADVIHVHGDQQNLEAFGARFRQLAPDVVLNMVLFGEQDARTFVTIFHRIARRVIAISSQDVYRAYGRLWRTEPGPPDPVPLTEDSPLRQRLYPHRGTFDWGQDYEKILVERVVMGNPALPGTILRLPMVYGPNDGHRIFPYLKRMDDERPAILLRDVQARWRWSRGYVENVAEAIALAIVDDRAAGRIYNVAEPEALSEEEWVRKIGNAARWNRPIITVPKHDLPGKFDLDFEQHWVVDTSRIRDELGYAESIPRDEALRRTIAWERAHPPEQVDPTDFDYAAEDAALATTR